jgi:hypothetical protein
VQRTCVTLAEDLTRVLPVLVASKDVTLVAGMKDPIMPGPRDEDDVDEEKRDTDDENDEYQPRGEEAEPWQVGANCCTSEGQDRSMERVA